MFKKQIAVVLAASVLSSAAFGHEHAAHPHWSYDGTEGPDHWAEMEANFSTCSTGKNQSPVNLTGFIKAELLPLKFDYKTDGDNIINNGHTVQVNFTEGSSMTLNGHNFGLKQFHVHSPSENQINGKTFPMEAHFVHADVNGNLAVIAVMFEEG
ncbi:MAG: carbonic anhydrase family protein, partial [Gallionella sp.]